MLLSSHLIIFWLSQDSNVTPPVCLVAFAAAAIAGTQPMRTGVTSWKIAKGLYLVPALFAFTPLVTGDWPDRFRVFLFAALGLYAVAGLLQWHLESRLTVPSALALLAAAICLLSFPLGLVVQLREARRERQAAHQGPALGRPGSGILTGHPPDIHPKNGDTMSNAKSGDTVHIHYTGKLDDGTTFDSSSGRDPLSFELGSGQVIAGFDKAVEGMAVGDNKSVKIEANEATIQLVTGGHR